MDKTAALFLARGLLGEIPLELKLEQDDQPVVADETVSEESRGEPNVAFFDLETQRLAEEVGGWGNVHLMRLAVGVLYDKGCNGFQVFSEEQVDNLIERLRGYELVVGFNIKRFDYRVLGAYTGFDFRELPTFDILEDIYQRLGFRLSLGHLAEQTLGKAKIADGIQAVRWLREGKLDAVVEYCKDDVAITRDLFYFGVSNGYLIYQTREGQPVRLPVNWNLENMVREVSRSRV